MTARFAGVDLGKSAVKIAVGTFAADGTLRCEASEVVIHEGRPLERFAELYRTHGLADCAAVGATGLHGEELGPPVLHGLPEEACLEAALEVRRDLPEALNLVSLGARGYAAMARDASGRIAHAASEQCSSGTGETMIKTAARFGRTLAEADQAALGAASSIAITARCSVFAKTEMTHFGNQGRPADELLRGYFDSIARYLAALLARVRVPGPVLLIGGGSELRSVQRALAEHTGGAVIVPEGARLFEALGAMRLAADGAHEGAGALPAEPDSLLRRRRKRFEVHRPAREWEGRVTRLPALPASEEPGVPCVLGLDLGSTGSKAVLTSIRTGEPVLDVYDRTRGNPVEAAQRLVRTIRERVAPDLRAIGVTGSGREAVATVLRAAYLAAPDRIVVINEIVAHATAAIRLDDRKGESLSIVEIGGQDAKFIQVAGGRIVESDLNKACSAGTGSFMEEQAALYGVHDLGELGELAAAAERPPDLGQMCTVFVAQAAAEAHGEGFTIADLFGGFQYSVVHNYLHRVMGQRTFGERIFFQGKPACGRSLAWTLAAVSGREVIVPPRPGEMGAWGIGLCARDALGVEPLLGAERLPLEPLLEAAVVARGELRCRDRRCQTLCTIDRTAVRIGAATHQVLSGGACPKYEISTATRAKLPQDAPSAFDEREALLARFTRERPASGDRGLIAGVPEAGALVGWLPWLFELLGELGVGARLLPVGPGALSRGEERCWSYDACAPVKTAHGVADAGAEMGVDRLFFPKLLAVGDRDGPGGATCAMEQGLPEMIRHALGARGRELPVLMPPLDLADPARTRTLHELRRIAAELDVDPLRIPAAVRRADAAQADFERELAAIGRRTLAYGRARGIPTVVLCGALHVLFDGTVNAGVPGSLRQNGVLALPMDCYPLTAEAGALPAIAWADARRALRVALAARARGDVFPLLLSSFGCGPASFLEHVFEWLMAGFPHTAIESDGHGGTAGFVTRIQAFLHGVRGYRGGASPATAARLAVVAPIEAAPFEAERGRRVVTPAIGERLGHLLAASLRSAGVDAVCSGENDARTLALGRRDCSGKECLPYQLIWGGFRSALERETNGDPLTLVQVTGQGACRNCMFDLKDRISLAHLGASGRVRVRHPSTEDGRGAGGRFMLRYWVSTVAWGVLQQLAAYHRPAARTPGAVDEACRRHIAELERLTAEPQPAALLPPFLNARRHARPFAELIGRAAREIAELGGERRGERTVLLTGDIYVRVDDFASDGLVGRLNERGLRVILDPACALIEYIAEMRSGELIGLPTGLIASTLLQSFMERARLAIYDAARASHPWLPMPDVRATLRAGAPLLDGTPVGEAPMTVGAAVRAWQLAECDGVVVVGPWGCGPSLIAESVLRHCREIPMLFVYFDGTPLDDRRLNGFAHRVRRAPARAVVRAAPGPFAEAE